jgi:hypothetical protein
MVRLYYVARNLWSERPILKELGEGALRLAGRSQYWRVSVVCLTWHSSTVCTCIRVTFHAFHATSNLSDAMAIVRKEKISSTTRVKQETVTTRSRGKQRTIQSDTDEDGGEEAPNGVEDVNDPDEDAHGEEEEEDGADEEENARTLKRQRVNGEGGSRASSVQEQDIPQIRIKTLPRDTDGY